jgi:hypothetical protein
MWCRMWEHENLLAKVGVINLTLMTRKIFKTPIILISFTPFCYKGNPWSSMRFNLCMTLLMNLIDERCDNCSFVRPQHTVIRGVSRSLVFLFPSLSKISNAFRPMVFRTFVKKSDVPDKLHQKCDQLPSSFWWGLFHLYFINNTSRGPFSLFI